MKVQNLNETEAWGAGTVLSPGRHLCQIDRADEGQSSGGHPQIELEVRAIAGPEAGGTIRDWMVVIPSSYGRVRQLLEAAGIEVQGGDWDLPVGQLVGRKVAVIVRMEKKERGKNAGKEFATVAAYDLPKDSDVQAGADVPADTAGFAGNGAGSAVRDEDIPF